MQANHTLSAKKREKLGSRYANRVRQAGGLPAVMYGHGADPVAIVLDAKETVRFVKSGEKVFTVNLEGDRTPQTVLIKDIQFDYLGDTIIHVDFARVDLDELVEVTVPVRLVGEAEGLKSAGAVLLHPVSELDLRCKVTAIPERIDVDISALGIGQSIHVHEIKPPAGIEILTDGESVVATIHMKVEEPTAEAAATTGAAGAEPVVLREKKDDEKDSKEKDKK